MNLQSMFGYCIITQTLDIAQDISVNNIIVGHSVFTFLFVQM